MNPKHTLRPIGSLAALLVVALSVTLTLAAPADAGTGGWHESYTGTFEPQASNPSTPTDPGLFTDVAALSPRSVLAVGFSYNGGDYFNERTPLIEQWDGHAWSAWDNGALPVAIQSREIGGIAARSLSDVWITVPATTDSDPSIIAHWDGHSWSTVTSDGLPPYWTGQLLLRGSTTSIVGCGTADAGATAEWSAAAFCEGDAFIATYRDAGTNAHWLLRRYARNGALTAAVARTAKDGWAVGVASNSRAASGSGSLIEHWNGTSWHHVKASAKLFLLDVAAAGKSSAMAIGAKNPINGSRRALLWNGKHWRNVGGPKGKPYLHSVTVDPDGGYWASGSPAPDSTRAAYYRYHQGHWKLVVGPRRKLDGPVKHQFVSINALATSGNSVWAVGYDADDDCGDLDGCANGVAGAPIVDSR